MFRLAINELKTALLLFIFLSILTGIIYPLVVTGIAQTLFHKQANGSLIVQDGKLVGSYLIGQAVTDPAYFWGRPSATSPFPYNAASSSGSNMGPTNPAFLKLLRDRVLALQSLDPENKQPVPVDLVTASGSGLDPDISPLAAFYQVPRVAKTRHLAEKDIQKLVQQQIIKRPLGLLGEPRVNVLQLNLALDKFKELGFKE